MTSGDFFSPTFTTGIATQRAREERRGVAAKISDVRADLKANHALSQQQVWEHLTYLISQGWVEEEAIEKQVRVKSGMTVQISPASLLVGEICTALVPT